MWNSVILQLLCMLILYSCQCSAKYLTLNELGTNTKITDWKDQISGTFLELCQKNQDIYCFGKQANPYDKIYWQKVYSLPKTSRLDIFIEYQITGIWNDYRLQLFANNVLVYSQLISFIDINRECYSNFLYESYMYVSFTQDLDQLVLEFKVNKVNVGLYIQNIIINQRTQSGKNQIIPFFGFLPDVNYIPTCRPDSGLEFFQYFCKCADSNVYQGQCQSKCDKGYLYDQQTNECYLKQNCDACFGKNTILQCNSGYYSFQGTGPSNSDCLSRCPEDYFSDPITMTCIEMAQHLSETENRGYPIDHYFFYKSTSDFFHFFKYNDILVKVTSTPKKVRERSFVYHKNKFVAGSYEKFKSQTVLIQLKVKHSQHKLRFRAIGHFIDFMPSELNVYINGVLQPESQLILSQQNEQKLDQDYIAYFDYQWVRTEFFPVNFNNILFTIEQPSLLNQGYFYLEDIHVFQFRCVTSCDACFKIDYCTPCLNPANKKATDCSCETGYSLKNDVCISCPTYCTSCSIVDVCDDCKASTKRINPPACDTCPDQFYVVLNQDNCQPCIQGCKRCSSSLSCNICLSGYFKTTEQKCVQQCLDGYFNDGSNIDDPICSLCDVNCHTCENTQSNCTSCSTIATLVNSHCYSCPEGQYLSGIICEQCMTGCQICKSGSNCQLCQETYYLQIDTGTCVEDCGNHYFGNLQTRTCDLCDNTCSNCLGATSSDCLNCAKGLILNREKAILGFCSQNCQPGFYPKGDYCAKCWKGCSSCIDSTQACLICAPKFFRLQLNGNCYEICPSGYYNNILGYTCSACDLSCKTCNAGTIQSCLSCATPTSLYKNQCLQQCPDGYGSINSICQECTPNCRQCFGLAQNQCLKCSKGYYFFHNQCFFKCPLSFIGIRPQYICKCIYDVCVICNETQYFYNNFCYDVCPQGLFGYNGLCLSCDRTCETCFGESSESCSTCKNPLILFQHQCVTQCIANTFHNTLSNQCEQCHSTCSACTGPNENNCIACYDGLLTPENTCVSSCPNNQYLVQQEKRCLKCDSSCLTCFSNSNKNCLTCKNLFYEYECVDSCPINSQLDTTITKCISNQHSMDKCSYQCATCQYIPRYCTICYGNRIGNPPNCDCENGYFDDGSSGNCQKCANKCLACSKKADQCVKCKGDRLLPLCECPKYYYDDGFSVNCLRCQDNCETCSHSGCLTCLNNRIDPPSCVCPDGYYEAYSDYCQECAQQCLICSESEKLCKTCSSIRINPPLCDCPIGYFQNSNEDCQLCDQTCIECDINGCLTCFGNREGPDYGLCHCATIGISRLQIGSVYCTDCQIGVPFFGLNEEFNGFMIDFGAQVEFATDIDENEICSSIFETQSLQKLGKNPLCDAQLNVLFGENPSLQVGDLLYLKSQFILQGCPQQFSSIKGMPLSIPSTIDLSSHKPVVVFKELPSPVNICQPIEFKFIKKHYNGGQNLKILTWKKILPPDSQIDKILDEAVQNNREELIFPRKIFQEKILYKFAVTFQSFAHLQNTQYIVFTAASYSSVVFAPIEDQNEFTRNQEITIPCLISYYNCEEENPPTETLQYGVSIHDNILNGTISEGLIDGFSQIINLSFKPYYFNFSNPYTIVFYSKLIRTDYVEVFNYKFDIYIIPQPLIITIKGGNRLIDCNDDLFLNASIIDQDLSQQEQNDQQYQCFWSCNDIKNQQPCIDSKNVKVSFDHKCDQQINARTFPPYSVMIFQVSVIKGQTQYSSKISIQVIEIDLPQLEVIGPDSGKQYNFYDEFIFELIYPNANPDSLMYAGAIIYDQVVQATFRVYYLEFKFKLSNFFTNFTLDQGNNLKLRLSIYDPRFVMPSLNSQILNYNIPPNQCQMYLNSDNLIEFLDYLYLTVIGCQDNDSPLKFSLGIYPNQSILQEDQMKSSFNDYIEIIPQSEESIFKFTLPYFNNQSVVVILNIQDSKGGRTNLTQQIKVKQYQNLKNDTLLNYIKTSQTLDQRLIAQQIVSIRISTMTNSEGLREELFNTTLLYDQNQTILYNQSERLYKTLAVILDQNYSLVALSENQLIYQLNYRTSIAQQNLKYLFEQQKQSKMTSAQNIEKQSYTHQLQIFVNILSSILKYRVSKQITSNDVLKYYSNIIEYLQKISVANEPLCKIQTSSSIFNFGNLTSKMIYETVGTTLESDNYVPNDIRGQTNFYEYSLTRYIENPFQVSGGFPKNSSGYQAVDPKMTINSTNNSQLSTSIQYQFPVNKKTNVTQKCIVQVNSTVWSAEICKTVPKEGEVICQCNQLSPTSIMEALNIIEDKLDQLYSLDTLAAFSQFPFYKTFIFYFYVLVTGLYISLTYWGMKVDERIFVKIQQESVTNENQNAQIMNSDCNSNKPLESYQEKATIFARSIIRQSPIDTQRIRAIYSLKKQPSVNSDSCPQLKSQTSDKELIAEKSPTHPQNSSNQDDLPLTSKKVSKSSKFNKFKAFVQYMKFFHQILQVIYRDDEKKPRALRATILYTSIIGSLTMLLIFNQPDNLSLLITLNLLTAPLNKIYQLFLEKLLIHHKKLVRSFGAALMAFVGGFMSYNLLAGLSLLGSVAIANKWAYIFIASFSLDNLIYCPLQLIVQYWVHGGLLRIPSLHKLLNLLIDEKGKEFLRELFENAEII